MSVLKRAGSKKAVQQLWQRVRQGDATAGANCPVCCRPMREVLLADSVPSLPLDVCVGCQFIWFDPKELERFPPGDSETTKPLPEKAREILALEALRQDNERVKWEMGASQEGPEELWMVIPALFGLPVEEDVPQLRNWPWLTYGLGAILVAAFALTAGNLEAFVKDFGLMPAQWRRHDGATFLTSFFLHGGPWHLIGNVYFLLIFGDNVEDDLGRWRYVVLLAISALVGDVFHIVGNPQSNLPCIGASGGISGVITYYALRFPKAQLGILFRYAFFFRWMHISAFMALFFWFLMQFVYVYLQQMGVGNVAALAHLGGAAVGVVAWILWRNGSSHLGGLV